jgi:hypothetical protein
MRDLPHAAREPCRQLRGYCYEFVEHGGRQFPLQFMESVLDLLWSKPSESAHRLARRPMRECELPMRRMPKLDGLLSQCELPCAPRRQIDRPDRHLRREPEAIGGCRAARHDHLAALGGERLDGGANSRICSVRLRIDRDAIAGVRVRTAMATPSLRPKRARRPAAIAGYAASRAPTTRGQHRPRARYARPVQGW